MLCFGSVTHTHTHTHTTHAWLCLHFLNDTTVTTAHKQWWFMIIKMWNNEKCISHLKQEHTYLKLTSRHFFPSSPLFRSWAFWTLVEFHIRHRVTSPSLLWLEVWSLTEAWLPLVMAPSAWRLYRAWPVCLPFPVLSLTAHPPTPLPPTLWTTIHPTSMDSTVRARYIKKHLRSFIDIF